MSVIRGAALAVGVALAAGVLTGCADDPGAAAVVNGETITTAELATATAELSEMFPGQGLSAATVLSSLVQEPVIVDTAEQHGITVSDADARALLQQTADASSTPVATGEGAMAIARISLVQQAFASATDADELFAAVDAALIDAEITVNPRFGTLDPKTVAVLDPTTPDWIVTTDAQ